MNAKVLPSVLAIIAGLQGVAGLSAPTASVPAPEIFAPGVVSGPANDGSPTFSPDGKTVFFTRGGGTWSIIMESHHTSRGWSAPTIASFSGQWQDSGPALSADGTYLVFASVRPAVPQPQPDSKAAPIMAGNIWRVNRVGAGWGEPFRLPDTVNITGRVFRPSLAADGSVYVNAAEKGGKFRLYRAQFENGAYRKAEPLPFSDGSNFDVDAEIAPDESFLVFSSNTRTPSDPSHERLFIVLKKDGAWGPVTPIRYAGDQDNGGSNDNEARLGPDHRTLYFSSDRSVAVHFPRTMEQARQDVARLDSWDNSNANVWVLPLSSWLEMSHPL